MGSIVISCSSQPASTPPAVSTIDKATRGDLVVQAIGLACGDPCTTTPIYVRDQLFDVESLDPSEPMPDEFEEAVVEAFPNATMASTDEVEAIVGELDAGEAILITLGPLRELAEGVAGIDIGLVAVSARGQTIQFRWDGSTWAPADSEDSGVTVTSFVS